MGLPYNRDQARQSKPQEIIFLRDHMGFSWRTIAKIIYPREYNKNPDKTVLKVRGMYTTYSKRYNVPKDHVITFPCVITLYDGDPRDLNITTEYGAASSRVIRRIGMDRVERHKEELLQLLKIVYDITGISRFDVRRTFLMGLLNIGRALLGLVDLNVANADIKNNIVNSVHAEALAYVYVVFHIATYGTPYSQYMTRVWSWILSTLPKKKRIRERKISSVRKKITEILPKAIPLVLNDQI